jgi:hypothetical protein
MDVEKLPEVTRIPAAPIRPGEGTPDCAGPCESLTCRTSCSLEVIDSLLSLPAGVSPEEADLLLELRHLLKGRLHAEAGLRVFCELRRRMEQRHYLAFYRLRRWLENQVVAQVLPAAGRPPVRVPLRIGFFCVEAIRRESLCQCLNQGTRLIIPRLEFAFLPASKPPGAPASEELPAIVVH